MTLSNQLDSTGLWSLEFGRVPTNRLLFRIIDTFTI